MSTSPLSNTPLYKKVSPTGAKKRLLEFLRELLDDVTNCDVITWTDHANEEFRIIKPHELANRWGAATGNTSMTYDKMSRGLRHSYAKKTLEKTPGKDFRYRFLSGSRSGTPGSSSSTPPLSSNSVTSTLAPSTPPATATSTAFDPVLFNMLYQLYTAFPQLIPKND